MQELADLSMIAYWADSITEYQKRGYKAFAINPRDAIDEAYGLLKDNRLVIVIRGTDEMQDWSRRNLSVIPSRSKTLGVEVHRPLWEGCKQIIPAIEAMLQVHQFEGMTIAGHSKGGAMAHLCGWHFRLHRPTVVSFGAPRCFSRNFDGQLVNHYRIAHCGDPVPRVPPRALGWEHFGKSIVLNKDGTMDDRPGAWVEAMNSAGPIWLIKNNFGNLLSNHFAYSKL